MNIEEMKNKIKPLNLIIKYKCKKCNKIFTDKRSLKYHIANNVCETIIKNITNKTTNNINANVPAPSPPDLKSAEKSKG